MKSAKTAAKAAAIAADKTVLIVIDDAKGVAEMATEIAGALKGNRVMVKKVSEFAGNDILPTDAFFLGCEAPNQDSFAYITDFFRHINLAGRCCGIFSSGAKDTVDYLMSLIHDSEVTVKNEPLLPGSRDGIKKWAQSVVSGY